LSRRTKAISSRKPAGCENQDGDGQQGKSGSARVIYFLATAEVIYLVMAYPKSTKDSLTDAEKAALKTLTQQLKDEV
jgi:hypothetical protein